MFEGKYIESGIDRLDSMLLFSAEIDKMTDVIRQTLLVNGQRRENDAEHSWHIAVMSMLFKEYAIETPDVSRVCMMLVVHDLVEIYAGDTFAYDEKGNEDKEEREKKAADKLFSLLPEDIGLNIRALWEEFDEMKTVDAKYGACMDRLQPFLHNTLTDGHTWKRGTRVSQVLKRTNIIREFMPKVYNNWVYTNIVHAVKEGWLVDDAKIGA